MHWSFVIEPKKGELKLKSFFGNKLLIKQYFGSVAGFQIFKREKFSCSFFSDSARLLNHKTDNSMNSTLTRTKKYYLTPRWLATNSIVIIVFAIIFYSEFVYVAYLFLPEFKTSAVSSFILALIWHFFWGNLIISYLRCIFTDPGGVPFAMVRHQQ